MNNGYEQARPETGGAGHQKDAGISRKNTAWGTLVTFTPRGERTEVCFPRYRPDSVIEWIGSTPGSRFHPETGLWSIPSILVDNFQARLERQGLQVEVKDPSTIDPRRRCCGRR